MHTSRHYRHTQTQIESVRETILWGRSGLTSWCRKSRRRTGFLEWPLWWGADQPSNRQTWWQSSCRSAEQTADRRRRLWCSSRLKCKRKKLPVLDKRKIYKTTFDNMQMPCHANKKHYIVILDFLQYVSYILYTYIYWFYHWICPSG